MEKFLLEMEMEKDMDMEHGWNNYVIYNFALCIFLFLPFGAFCSLLEPFGAFWSLWSLLELLEWIWNMDGIIME